MKFIATYLLFFISGCAQLQHGQIQPVLVKDIKNKIMFTTCNGAVEDWASCYAKARNTCPSGFKIIEQNENANGGFRDVSFKCN